MASATRCNGTVLYGFLVEGDLPLWPVWEAYWASCPTGSFAIAIHTQNASSLNTSIVKRVRLVPSNETVQGDLRFSYRMIEATFALYAQLAPPLPNGCSPRWIQLLSDSCAPVVPCQAVHRELAQSRATRADRGLPRYPGSYPVTAESRHKYGLPTVFGDMIKTSQWITIEASAADALLASSAAIKARWGSFYHWKMPSLSNRDPRAYDEWLWWQEVRHAGFDVQPQSLTRTVFNSKQFAMLLQKPKMFEAWHAANHINGGHPPVASTQSEVYDTCMQARQEHRFFARKFDGKRSEVMHALLNCTATPLSPSFWVLDDDVTDVV